MKVPRVSVVVPNYNHAAHLAQRLDSVLNQTFKDIELIYLDDASTDDSATVFAAYADDPRVRSHVNATNTGNPSVQWNKGVALARGKYVWIAESDDYADPDFLEVLVDRLDRHPRVGLAYCQSWETDANGQDLRTYAFHTEALDSERWRHDFVNNGRDECRRYLSTLNTIPNASAVLFRRSVYKKAGGADESLKYCGDWMLWFSMLMRSDVAFVADPLNHYRRHEGAFSNAANLDIRDAVHVLHRKLVDMYPDVMASAGGTHSSLSSVSEYQLGRHALQHDRVQEARWRFRKALLRKPSPSVAVFLAASYMGRGVYRTLDGLKHRLVRARTSK